jgi:ketosteroid isomerase-like protein
MPTTAAPSADYEMLRMLNRDYIDSVQRGDVRRFDELLAAEFYCSNPDGTLIERQGFLAQTARPVTISGLRAHEVLIRLFGDIAIIHARTVYKQQDGGQGGGRYTDVWSREGDTWRCVSAHVTRL